MDAAHTEPQPGDYPAFATDFSSSAGTDPFIRPMSPTPQLIYHPPAAPSQAVVPFQPPLPPPIKAVAPGGYNVSGQPPTSAAIDISQPQAPGLAAIGVSGGPLAAADISHLAPPSVMPINPGGYNVSGKLPTSAAIDISQHQAPVLAAFGVSGGQLTAA